MEFLTNNIVLLIVFIVTFFVIYEMMSLFRFMASAASSVVNAVLARGENSSKALRVLEAVVVAIGNGLIALAGFILYTTYLS